MATKKTTKSTSATSKKAAPKRPATTVTTVKSTTATSRKSAGITSKLDNNTINIVMAELIGTFILTLVALLTLQNIMPLYVGLTLALLVFGIGTVSGAHVNPAVTFGLWAAQKVKSILVPFYWGAQLLGAMGAVVVLSLVSGGNLALDFGHFGQFYQNIFAVELIGTAVFLFGFYLVLNRLDLSAGHKALGVGLSLMVGILVASSLFSMVQTNVDQTKISNEVNEQGQQVLKNVPHELKIKGATLNPAIALASTEHTDSQLQNQPAGDGEKQYSRFGMEVIVGTLLGAALGANLARLVSYRFNI